MLGAFPLGLVARQHDPAALAVHTGLASDPDQLGDAQCGGGALSGRHRLQVICQP